MPTLEGTLNGLVSDQVESPLKLLVVPTLESPYSGRRVVIVFKNIGVRICKKELVTLLAGLVRVKETGSFIEVHFVHSLLMDFLASVHVHLANEEVGDWTKNKLVTCLPFLCGLSVKDSGNKVASQSIVKRVVDSMSGLPPTRDPDYYIRFLQNLWLETQQVFLNCVYEARMRSVTIYPPPGDKQIVLALNTLYMHDVIPLAYYLENVDASKIHVEGLLMQECNMDDNVLRAFGKHVWNIRKVQMTGNYFTSKGIYDVTRQVKGGGDDNLRIRSLDLSDSNIDDEALAKLMPVLPYLEELCLADNFFTWYGIRKIVQPHKRWRRLRRLDMSRCHLNEHAFYELIPLILRTEQVLLEGNEFSPLELKIFARQVREMQQGYRLETLTLNGCQLDDDSLHEIAKFATKIANLQLQNNAFTIDGISALVRSCKKHEMGVMKTLNLRGCKLNSECLNELSDIIPRLQSFTASNNNFNHLDAAKGLANAIETAATDSRKIAFVDLRHCRLIDSGKKLLSEVCRKRKIDIKMW